MFFSKLWTKQNSGSFKVLAKTTWCFDFQLLLGDSKFKTTEEFF